jgi:hypothetical protein
MHPLFIFKGTGQYTRGKELRFVIVFHYIEDDLATGQTEICYGFVLSHVGFLPKIILRLLESIGILGWLHVGIEKNKARLCSETSQLYIV